MDSTEIAPDLYSPVVLIDGVLVQEERSNAGGEQAGYRYLTNAADIDRVRRQLHCIANASKPWSPPATDRSPGPAAGRNGTS